MSFLQSPFNPMATFDTQTTTRSISSIDPKLSRTNYYDGRLLRASDLVRDQLYLDERLREVGRSLGQGIVRGLEVTLTPQKKLIVNPGLAVTPSGRVLELETTTLEINLLDSAKLNELNPGFRSLAAGLYAVVVQYAEQGTGSSEIYPKDLESQRGFHFNAYAEGVEFTLVKMAMNLPLEKLRNLSTEEIAVYSRSALVRSLVVANPGQPVGIGEDGVALGLLAVEYGEPQWLDKGLLRRPFRQPQTLNYLQQDLYNHYEELLPSVIELRKPNQFLAQQYFSILPPVGSIPKESIDPINGFQNYFPDGFEVSISPVRADDVDSIIQQSMALEPIDLQVDRDVDIMVAVVLDDINFSYLARQLQVPDPSSKPSGFAEPQHIDEILLSNFATQTDDNSTTADLWKKLWAASTQIFYVRRPVRVAETQVSAVVLAEGNYQDLINIVSLPKSTESLEEEIDSLTQALDDSEAQVTQLTNANGELIKELNQPVDEKIAKAQAAQLVAEQAAADANAKLADANTKLADANTKIETLTESLNQDEQDKTDLNAQLSAANEAVNSANQAASSANDALNSANAEIADLKDQLQKALDQIKNLSDSGSGNDQRIKDLQAKVDALQAALDQANAATKDAQANADSANAEIKDLKDALSKAQDQIKQLTDSASTSTGNADIDALKKKLDATQAALDKSNAALKDTQAKADASAAQIADLQQQLKNALAEIEKLKQSGVNTVPAETTPKLSAEDLANIKVQKLAQLIPASLEIATADREAIKAGVSADSSLLQPLSQLKAIVPAAYQTALWATAAVLIETGKTQDFVDFVVSVLQKSLPLGLAVAATTKFKFTNAIRNAWSSVDLK